MDFFQPDGVLNVLGLPNPRIFVIKDGMGLQCFALLYLDHSTDANATLIVTAPKIYHLYYYFQLQKLKIIA